LEKFKPERHMMVPSPSQAIVDLNAYAHNLGVVRGRIPAGAKVIAVVKADAYGHGLSAIARCAEECGVEMLGVACLEEGVAVRSTGVRLPILVMMQPDAETLPLYLEHKLTPLFSTQAMAEKFAAHAQQRECVAAIHCHIDTGMGRQGFALNESAEAIRALSKNPHLRIEGVSTHFPVANHINDEYTRGQIAAYTCVIKTLAEKGVKPGMLHTANSAAVLNYPDSHFNTVRVGLMAYGVWPSNAAPDAGLLRPAFHWESHITLVRHFPAGVTVGYERTYTTNAPMRGAIVPIGYADGYPTALSNKAHVLIRGERCPVRGKVSMDQILVDITHLPEVAEGERVVLLGRDGAHEIGAADLAELAGCIPYEILIGIGNRVPRIYKRQNTALPASARA